MDYFNQHLFTIWTNFRILSKQQHQLRYHTPKKCGVCQQLFANQMELRTHTRHNHEIEHNANEKFETSKPVTSTRDNDGHFRCDICGILETSKELLSEHVALHENQLKCVVCGTILKHKGNLVLHMRIHVRLNSLNQILFD